ncbi:alpha/beta fold hydrolase [Acinetobacter silvestris]|uniref:Alpha/beta hydrolase n=1 Tax=Acinetobacter silvestris TaxID=1977882 RepID=A0A1Y3CN82_9GAMM|nr:alpha/beta fold hydrolase [Acinetobacter silvestris]OTG67657.1 alpha/beta hydrolase [Acinetobacter silvestris]
MNENFFQRNLHFYQSDAIAVDIYHQPDNKTNIILLPALGVAIDKYDALIQALIQQNFNVITADYPGCGRNTPTVSAEFDYGYADLLGYFIPQLVQISKDLINQKPIILGHSLGGHLATLYAQYEDVDVIGIATGNIGFLNWNLKGKFNILKAVITFNAMILKDGFLAGYKIGFGNKEAKTLMQDWSKTVLTGHYRHIIADETISENSALFIQFKNDDFAPFTSTLALSRYFKHPQIEILDLTALTKGNQHSAWIKQPKQVVARIQEWITNQSQ